MQSTEENKMPKKTNYYNIYNIPKEVNLFGHAIKVVFVEDLAQDNGFTGLADYNKGTIYIQPGCGKFKRTKESVQTTFCHEVLHFILKFLGFVELTDDEEFVQLLALAIHQIFF